MFSPLFMAFHKTKTKTEQIQQQKKHMDFRRRSQHLSGMMQGGQRGLIIYSKIKFLYIFETIDLTFSSKNVKS